MGIIIVAIFVIVCVLFAFLLEALWLFIATRIFSVEGATYRKALRVSALFLLINMVVGVFITILIIATNQNFLRIGIAVSVVISFFVANFLYKKYYQTGIGKNFLIFLVKSIFSGVVESIVVGFLIILPIRTFIITPFFVNGSTMEPNFSNNQYIIVDEFGYKQTAVGENGNMFFAVDPFLELARQDVTVFRYPKKPDQFFIKRVIGLPGEKVWISDGKVTIYSKEHPAGFVLDEHAYLPSDVRTMGEISITLKDDEYFMLGDNRMFSSDSRSWGPVNKNLIVGKYWMTLFK